MSQNDNQEESFSIHEFKGWMSEQDLSDFFDITAKHDKRTHEYCGKEARAKVSRGKLLKRAISEDALIEDLVEEFADCGGVITAVNGKMLTIETDLGLLQLPRFCVKIKREV